MELKDRILSWLKRNKFVFLILAVGIAFMLIPSREEVTEESEPTQATVQRNISEELAQILSQIKGAGKVQVMLTVKTGRTTVYQFDQDSNGQNTVIITNADRAQEGLIQRTDPPQYLGAIVVCTGADSAAVRLSIIEAVSKVTGLGTDRISVLKMK